MNSKRLWSLVFAVALVLVYGSSIEEAQSAQVAGGQAVKGKKPPVEVLIVWFNEKGRVIRAMDDEGNVVEPTKGVPEPKARILNRVLLVEGSHCIWDNGQLWCS
ncbi:MAG TPA: hypothetical protein VH701_23900 [Vicinamibacterales bacterium]